MAATKAESAEKALEPIEVDLLYAWLRPVCRIEHQPAFVKTLPFQRERCWQCH